MYFWIFQCFFRYFWIFLKIYQNMGQKLGSNNNKITRINVSSKLAIVHCKGTTRKITLKSISLHIDVLQFNQNCPLLLQFHRIDAHRYHHLHRLLYFY